MSWTYTEDYYKEYTRKTWNESTDVYPLWVDVLEPYTDPLLKAAAIRPGQRVLDLATGPGVPALVITERVGPEGEVVGVDLSDAMIEEARRRADRTPAQNVRFEVGDAEDLAFEDGSFDRVVSRFGLQIFTAPRKVLEEAFRVLEPGGVFAASVWASPGERSSALHAMIGPMLRHCTPDDDGYLPTPYELGGPGTLEELLEDAGFTEVSTERRRYEMTFEDADGYLEAMVEGSPVGPSLREEPEPVQEAVIEETRDNVERWGVRTEAGIKLDGEAVFASGRRPGAAGSSQDRRSGTNGRTA